MGFSAAGYLPCGAVQFRYIYGREGTCFVYHKRIGYLQPAVIVLFYIVLTISAVRAYRYRKENNIPMKKFLWLVALGIIVGMIVPGILASVFVLNFLR